MHTSSFTYITVLGVLSAVLLWTADLRAQSDIAADTDENDATAVSDESNETAAAIASLTEQLTNQQEDISQLKTTSSHLEAETKMLKDKLETATDERDELHTILLSQQMEDEQRFSIYGFMDISFTKSFPQFDNSAVYVITPRHTTFYMNNVNLYFKSNLLPTLETLVETRFTFQPNGQVTEYPYVVWLGNHASQLETYQRHDTTVDEIMSGTFKHGGVKIERAQIDWTPRDWFQMRLGRFLTPFGIFNEDHGSPVYISATTPFIISDNFLPNAQTGVMLHGRVFPSAVVDVEYGLTLSNGRGPMSEVHDLDENKAVGLRGKLNTRIRSALLSLGGYAYYGKYSDAEEAIHVYVDGDFNLADVDNPVQARETWTEKYKEYILTADVKLEIKGLTLLGEYVWRRTEHLIPSKLKGVYKLSPVLVGAPLETDTIQNNAVGIAMYGMVAYTLPLHKWLGNIRVTPYAGYDYFSPNDAFDYTKIHMIQFGLNVKPSPFVTLKSSAYVTKPEDQRFFGGDIWYWTNQVAVSF